MKVEERLEDAEKHLNFARKYLDEGLRELEAIEKVIKRADRTTTSIAQTIY